MKHIKIYEAKDLEQYEWIGNSILDYFFKNVEIPYSKLYKYYNIENYNKEDGVKLIIDFNVKKFNSEILISISNYIKFIEKFGKYKFCMSPNTYLELESVFWYSNIKELEEELIKLGSIKFHPNIKKYNL
jgi:hypothetical protein